MLFFVTEVCHLKSACYLLSRFNNFCWFQLIDVGSKISHGYGGSDEALSSHVLTNSQAVATNFHSYSSPPASAALTTNGSLTANGSAFSSIATSATGSVAYYRDAVAHVQSTPGSAASSLPLQPTHRVILTTTQNPSSGHVPITGGRTIVITGPSSVPSHSAEPAVKRVCVEWCSRDTNLHWHQYISTKWQAILCSFMPFPYYFVVFLLFMELAWLGGFVVMFVLFHNSL